MWSADCICCSPDTVQNICIQSPPQLIACAAHLMTQSCWHHLGMYLWLNQKSFICLKLGDCIKAHKFETLFNLGRVLQPNICFRLTHWSRRLIAAIFLRTPLHLLLSWHSPKHLHSESSSADCMCCSPNDTVLLTSSRYVLVIESEIFYLFEIGRLH